MCDQRSASRGGQRRSGPRRAVFVVSLRARRTVVLEARVPRAALPQDTAVHTPRRVLPAMLASYR